MRGGGGNGRHTPGVDHVSDIFFGFGFEKRITFKSSKGLCLENASLFVKEMFGELETTQISNLHC